MLSDSFYIFFSNNVYIFRCLQFTQNIETYNAYTTWQVFSIVFKMCECRDRGSGDWRRWWRRRYHESEVWRTEGRKNQFLACKPTLMIGGHVLHQIFALAEWRLCRIGVTGRTDTGSSVHGARHLARRLCVETRCWARSCVFFWTHRC